MRVAYLDCFSGIAGDMFLAALVHAGLDPDLLRAGLAKLGLDEFRVEVETTWRDAMEGVRVDVVVDHGSDPPHRRLADIRAILAASSLEPVVKERARRVFERLARAEGRVHGCGPEDVHFHEVGATDAIVDIVGTVFGLSALGVERLFVSAIALGSGFQHCAHGRMPVPVPATTVLLEGFPVRFSGLEGELVTPTGAALVAELAEPAGAGFSFVPGRVGYGFGARERAGGPPNALRLILGDVPADHEDVVLIETNLDDVTGQEVGHLIERCLAAGALDAYAQPLQMKKSRPGTLFAVLAEHARADALEALIFKETPTLGVRRSAVRRSKLERACATIETSLGPVRVKFARLVDGSTRAAPEHDDVARLATEHGLALRVARERIRSELPDWPAPNDEPERAEP